MTQSLILSMFQLLRLSLQNAGRAHNLSDAELCMQKIIFKLADSLNLIYILLSSILGLYPVKDVNTNPGFFPSQRQFTTTRLPCRQLDGSVQFIHCLSFRTITGELFSDLCRDIVLIVSFPNYFRTASGLVMVTLQSLSLMGSRVPLFCRDRELGQFSSYLAVPL